MLESLTGDVELFWWAVWVLAVLCLHWNQMFAHLDVVQSFRPTTPSSGEGWRGGGGLLLMTNRVWTRRSDFSLIKEKFVFCSLVLQQSFKFPELWMFWIPNVSLTAATDSKLLYKIFKTVDFQDLKWYVDSPKCLNLFGEEKLGKKRSLLMNFNIYMNTSWLCFVDSYVYKLYMCMLILDFQTWLHTVSQLIV